MHPIFMKKPSFRAIGKSIKVSMDNTKACADLWDQCEKDGICQTLMHLSEGKLSYGISYNPKEEKSFWYMVGTESAAALPEGWTELLIPEAEYAVFPVDTSALPLTKALADTHAFAYGEHFPRSSRKPAESPQLEAYIMEGDTLLRCELWIPME